MEATGNMNNQFNNAKEIRCSGGQAVPVNPPSKTDIPHDVDDPEDCLKAQDYRIKRAEFETWLSQQPTLHCSPELNGIYPVGEFGEVYWQYECEADCIEDWDGCIDNDPTNYRPYAKVRIFLPYIGPNNQEMDSEDDYVHDILNYKPSDHKVLIPATPEQKGVEHGEEKPKKLYAKMKYDTFKEWYEVVNIVSGTWIMSGSLSVNDEWEAPQSDIKEVKFE